MIATVYVKAPRQHIECGLAPARNCSMVNFPHYHLLERWATKCYGSNEVIEILAIEDPAYGWSLPGGR